MLKNDAHYLIQQDILPSTFRQPPEVWYFSDDDLTSRSVDEYLSRQHRLRESDPSTSLSSASEWLQVTDAKKPWDLSDGERNTLQKQCHKLYFLSPFAGNIIDTYAFYTVGGEGVKVEWVNEGNQNWWDMLVERNAWMWLSKDIVLLSYITGECFVLTFPLVEENNGNSNKLDIIEVHPTEITQINTDENDMRIILSYQRSSTPGGKAKKYLPVDTIHFKIKNVGGVLRGRPVLERVLKPLAMYDDWLMSRADLNRMRSRLPVIRYRSGLKETGLPIRSLPEPGSVIDAHKDVEEWSFPSLSIESGDAKDDGMEMKRYIAAGVNLPTFMVTGEGSVSEAFGATPVTLFESLQGTFKSFFLELLKKIMPAAYEQEKPTITFPDVDLRNFSVKLQAVLDEVNSGLLSRRSAQITLGLDPDEEEKWLQKELGLSESEVEQIPEGVLRKIITSTLFHSPAIRAGLLQQPFLEKLTKTFENRGWTE